MAVIRIPIIVLGLLFASSGSATPCQTQAQALLQKAEALPMAKRAGFIVAAFKTNETLGCGIVPAAHWSTPAPLPKGCDLANFDLCVVPGGIPVARQVQSHVEPDLFLKVQSAALKLREAQELKRSNRRLLQLILLSDAIRRGG